MSSFWDLLYHSEDLLYFANPSGQNVGHGNFKILSLLIKFVMISIACVEMRHSGVWKITSPWIRILKRRYYKKELDSAVIVAGNWGFLKSRCSCEPKNKFWRLWNVHEKFKNTWNLNTFSSYFIEIQIILNFHFKMNMQMLRMPFFFFPSQPNYLLMKFSESKTLKL